MLVHKPLRRWGNAYGILVSKAEARQLGLREGEVVDAELKAHRDAQVKDLPGLHAGHPIDLDAVLADDLADS